jgi:hypothetical protein
VDLSEQKIVGSVTPQSFVFPSLLYRMQKIGEKIKNKDPSVKRRFLLKMSKKRRFTEYFFKL